MGRSAKFDYASPEIAGPQFWNVVEELRQLGPLVWVESYGGFWAATTYEMNLRIAQDWQNFTSSQGVALNRPSFEAIPPMVPIELDPPRHRTFRKQVNPALTVKVVYPLEDRIRAIADEIIDTFIDQGSCDIAVDFARKFPGTVFFRLLAHCTDADFREAEPAARQISFESDDQVKFAAAAAQLRAWAARVFSQRAEASPADVTEDDIVAAIMRLGEDGEPWLAEEHASGLQILAQGGIGTSASVIGSVMLELCANPELQARVRADRSLIRGVVEEVLRLEAPVPLMFRTARQDVEIDGQRIKEGDKICLIFGAAGRDPAVFEHADQFDLDRPHCRHLTFGAGVHRCIGSNLARLQIRVAIEQLVTRLGEFRIPEGGTVGYSSRQSRGPSSIPLEFTGAGHLCVERSAMRARPENDSSGGLASSAQFLLDHRRHREVARRRDAAVDGQAHPGDEPGPVAGQVLHRPRHVPGIALDAEGVDGVAQHLACQHLLRRGPLGDPQHPRRVQVPGDDRVDADAVPSVLDRHVPGERLQRAFGGPVGGTTAADRRREGRDVDDRPSLAGGHHRDGDP